MTGIQLTTTRQEINDKLGDPGEGKSWFPIELATSKLPHAAVSLMANLISYDSNEDRSLNEIAKEVGMNPRTVRKHLDTLEEFGWLTYTPPVQEPTPGKRRKMSTEKSLAVFDNDDYACVNCGSRKKLTVDHIVPITRGGTDEMSNLQTLCHSCNAAKGNKIPEEI